jgi:hypothetical protein
MVTRKGKEKGEKKRGMRVGIEEGKEMEKRSWENRKGGKFRKRESISTPLHNTKALIQVPYNNK